MSIIEKAASLFNIKTEKIEFKDKLTVSELKSTTAYKRVINIELFIDGAYHLLSTPLVDDNPTGNCQLCCMQYANTVFSAIFAHTHPKHVKHRIQELLFKIRKTTYKRLMLLDLNLNDLDEEGTELSMFFDDDQILTRHDYKSTNGSLMTLLLINLPDE